MLFQKQKYELHDRCGVCANKPGAVESSRIKKNGQFRTDNLYKQIKSFDQER